MANQYKDGTTKFDQYCHLDDNDKFKITMNLDDLAEQILNMNYGTHRMICAMVKALEKRGRKTGITARLRKVAEEVCSESF